ncbi:MAG: aminotransferase class I/II-fold pyridoxal phosphate-dependent enzyme [Alphaproteobacteria bacterium]|jgi:8-amino-7-oxononanoate synthase|nr:aminotransferase class I/II-fold pyridoxal phosphate-dependent enzyme [Alphaproteobacteria bacterium]
MSKDSYRQLCIDLLKKQRLRKMQTVEHLGSARLVINDRSFVNFSSNDYLGLSDHAKVKQRSKQWIDKWGAGLCASRLLCANIEPFVAIEKKISRGKKTQSALILNSGFQANVSILSAILDRSVLGESPLVFCDRLNHASLHAGCAMANIHQIRYRHNDMNHLQDLLKKNRHKSKNAFIITESVFSMDGDVVDLRSLVQIGKKYNAKIYLDEAHATGVFGQKGFGFSTAFSHQIDFCVGTFGKAFGSFGAYIACSKEVREYLINRCGGLIYATALPPGILGSIDAAIDLIPLLNDRRAKLVNLGNIFRKKLSKMQIPFGTSSTQIIPYIIGNEKDTLGIAKGLLRNGIYAPAIRPPTIPNGLSRIRFSLSSSHSKLDINYLSEVLAKIRK